MSIIAEMGLILALLLLISGLVRGVFIGNVPPELFGDEIDVGYQAYSLLQTGKDIYSNPLPTYLKSLSESRAPLLIYATVPSVFVSGLNQFGVRLPEIIFGTLAPIIFLGLVYETSKNKKISILSGFVMSMTPWHILYSRSAFEVVILLDLVMLGTWLFLKKKYLISLVFFCLTFYTYSTAILFTPIFVLGIVLLNLKHINFNKLVLPVIASLIIVIPILGNIFIGEGGDRFSKVGIFSNQEVIKSINEKRQKDNSDTSWIWYNKIQTYSSIIYTNYMEAFSPEFLFVRGDPTMRHSIQIIGQVFPIWAPFLILGLYYLARKRQFMWLFWLMISPISASLTIDGSHHATRLFFMVAPVSVAIASGIYHFFGLFKTNLIKYSLFAIYSVLFVVQVVYVGRYYFIQYPKDSWLWWHVGFKDIYTSLNSVESRYSRIFINNTYEPALIRYLFYTQYPPAKFQTEFKIDQPTKDIVTGYDGFTLDNKVFFGNFSDSSSKSGIQNHLLPGSLYLISHRDNVGGDWDWSKSPPSEVNTIAVSRNKFGDPILYLIEKN